MPVVDTHAHIFHRSLKFSPGRRYEPNYDATLAGFLRQLDANGVTQGVLVQPSFLGTDNSYLLAALREQPARLRGVVVIQPTLSWGELTGLAAAGVVGIRLNLMGAELPDLRAVSWRTLLERLVQIDWFVDVQCEARDLPLVVAPLLAAGVKVVVDHFGRPDPRLGVNDPGFRHLLSVGHTRRVWVKLSGAYRNGSGAAGEALAAAAVPLLCEAFGAERLLWGSDWPHAQFETVASYAAARAQFERWITNPADHAAILGGGPTTLHRFGPAGSQR